MPTLAFTVPDYQPFTKIRAADRVSDRNDIKTLLNTTKLDDDNIQDQGITRADKLSLSSSAHSVMVNDSNRKVAEIGPGAAGTVFIGTGASAPKFLAAGTQGQILQSNGAADPSWIDNTNTPPTHYIKSANVNSDGQPDFIRPDGGGADDFTIDATSDDLVVVIENTEYTFTSDIQVTGLNSPATSNNTALLNDANANNEQWTKVIGEDRYDLAYDTGGASFLPTGGEGQLHGFKINDGSNDEYFIGRFTLASTATSGNIRDCRRGYFVNSSGTAIPRLPVANNDTLTIQKLYWVFLSSAGAAIATDIQPIYSHDQPGTPSTGQMWFDLDANQWNRYNGSTFDQVVEILIGHVIVDENDEVVGARSFDFFFATDEINTIELTDFNTTTILASAMGKISVLGTTISAGSGQFRWDITDTDIRVGTEDASTIYSLYITNSGQIKMEETAPYKRIDLKGHYHPHKPWRCVGFAFNDSSSDLASVRDYTSSRIQTNVLSADVNTTGVIADFTFTNLFIGQKYKVHYQLYMLLNGTGEDADVSFRDGTTQVARMQFQQVGSQAEVSTRSGSFIFEATASTFDVNVVSMTVGGTITGNGARSASFVQIEELSDSLIETTQH